MTKPLTRRQTHNRVLKVLEPVRREMLLLHPRPNDYPFDQTWGLDYEVDKDLVRVTAWSVPPEWLRPLPEVIRGGGWAMAQPWTDEGREVFDGLREGIEDATGLPCTITFVMSLWANTFGDDSPHSRTS